MKTEGEGVKEETNETTEKVKTEETEQKEKENVRTSMHVTQMVRLVYHTLPMHELSLLLQVKATPSSCAIISLTPSKAPIQTSMFSFDKFPWQLYFLVCTGQQVFLDTFCCSYSLDACVPTLHCLKVP